MKQLIWVPITFALILNLPLTLLGKDSERKKPIPTVSYVDLNSYVGLWHEILRIENEFQDDEPSPGDGPCLNTTAEYSFLPKGKIGVRNTCYRLSGAEIARAKARVVRGSDNAKLKVNFTGIPLLAWLGIGDGDYWILALGEKNDGNLYSWVLVGSPKLDYGWILSRGPILAESEIEKALNAAEAVGYDRNLFKSFQR